MGIVRLKGKEKLVALFNFSEVDRTAWIHEDDGKYTDLITGKIMEAKNVKIPAYGIYWMLKNNMA